MEDSGQSNERIHLLDYRDVEDEKIVVPNGEIRNYSMIIIHTISGHLGYLRIF